jgi:Leucine-rich repeat (LRR) protein
MENFKMFAKIRIVLLISGLLSTLVACISAPAVHQATPLPSTAESELSPIAAVAGTQSKLSFDCQKTREIPVEECQALVALYESTAGEDWEDNSAWLTSETPCNWSGVICEQGHVTELQLDSNQLVGSLPFDIGNLTQLKSLYLDKNQLSGPLPAQIGSLAKLQVARFGGNQFSRVPVELANLRDLVFLELWGNQLSGKDPR